MSRVFLVSTVNIFQISVAPLKMSETKKRISRVQNSEDVASRKLLQKKARTRDPDPEFRGPEFRGPESRDLDVIIGQHDLRDCKSNINEACCNTSISSLFYPFFVFYGVCHIVHKRTKLIFTKFFHLLF